MRYKKGKLSNAILPSNVTRFIGVYIDAKSIDPPTDLIRDIITQYPNNDIYKNKTKRIPGQIIFDPPLIYIVGQITPRSDLFEMPQQRYNNFQSCLEQIVECLGDTLNVEIAIDRGLCQELHGDDWNVYKNILVEIENKYKNIRFLVYKEDD